VSADAMVPEYGSTAETITKDDAKKKPRVGKERDFARGFEPCLPKGLLMCSL
jgi:hypothetical protein